MNRLQLEHIIRAAGDIAGDDEIVILGSTAVLSQFPEVPEKIIHSMKDQIRMKIKADFPNIHTGEDVGQVANKASYLTPRMPNDNPTISDLMQSIKLRFTHRYKRAANIRGNVAIWQRGFWDHIIRDQNDHNAHLGYIHFNPIKHGYAANPVDYAWSSFGRYLEIGVYPSDWGGNGDLPHLAGVNWE